MVVRAILTVRSAPQPDDMLGEGCQGSILDLRPAYLRALDDRELGKQVQDPNPQQLVDLLFVLFAPNSGFKRGFGVSDRVEKQAEEAEWLARIGCEIQRRAVSCGKMEGSCLLSDPASCLITS